MQRWSRGHKARGQGQGHKKNPRPRPAFPRTDTIEAKDRNARGQGQGPRTQAQVLSKKKKGLHKNFLGDLKKKKVFTKIFQAISTKKRFPKNFSSASQNFNNSKNSARPRAEDRPIFEDLRPRDQGQGLDLRGQGQGLQNLSSRPRTSSRTPPLPICIITTNIKKFLEALEARGKTAYIISIHDIIQAPVTNKHPVLSLFKISDSSFM